MFSLPGGKRYSSHTVKVTDLFLSNYQWKRTGDKGLLLRYYLKSGVLPYLCLYTNYSLLWEKPPRHTQYPHCYRLAPPLAD